jgi:hypothetical protein
MIDARSILPAAFSNGKGPHADSLTVKLVAASLHPLLWPIARMHLASNPAVCSAMMPCMPRMTTLPSTFWATSCWSDAMLLAVVSQNMAHLEVRAGLAIQCCYCVQVPTQVYLRALQSPYHGVHGSAQSSLLPAASTCAQVLRMSASDCVKVSKGRYLQANTRVLHRLESLPSACGVAADDKVCHPAEVCQLLRHLQARRSRALMKRGEGGYSGSIKLHRCGGLAVPALRASIAYSSARTCCAA